ncbi:MAG TPA: twin-arginine translocase subunit TatC [Pseudogracilibacillus sp.]|nr:twin-arginine translocase subunit TatC [Pseudogracilibacillus sp.]
MNVVDHLSELRNRIIVTGVFFVAFFILGFVFVTDIFEFFKKDIPFDLNITSPGEIIWIYITIASIVAIVCTLPILCLQLWLFIKPGLTDKERKASLSYIPAVFLLFIGGLIFGYLLFTTLILPFLLSLNDGMFNEIFTVEKYFRFMFRLVLPFAILFEIPIITMFLTSLGIITPDFLKRTRKYAYFVLLIVGALVTPPDIFLQLVVAIPLFILYEISIQLSSYVYKRKLRKHIEYMNSNQE